MQRKFIINWAITMLINSCCALAVFANAANQAQLTEQELIELKSKIADISNQLARDYSAADAIQKQLKQIVSDQQRIVKTIRELEAKRSISHDKLKATKIKLHSALAELDDRKSAISKLLSSIQILDQNEPMKLAFNQSNISQLDRHLTYLSVIKQRQLSLVRSLNADLSQARLAKNEYEAALVRLDAMDEKANAERKALIAADKKRKKILADLKQKIASEEAEIKELQANEQRLTNLLTKLNQAIDDVTEQPRFEVSFQQLKGKLGWPVNGKVKNKFGSSQKNGQIKRKGIIIQAPAGAPVRSISHGHVVFADWLRGYGLLLIVDHGGGYMTLYGHNEALFRETGEWVAANEVIASVGKTGLYDTAAVYFEVRADGEAVNPLIWCCS